MDEPDTLRLFVSLMPAANFAIAVGVILYLFRKLKPYSISEFEATARYQIPVIIADMATGEILHTTPATDALFGYFPGELLSMNVDSLVPLKVVDDHPGYRAKYAANPQSRVMLGVGGRRKDGTEIDVEVGLNAAVIDGRWCVIAMILDKRIVHMERG